MNKHLARKFTSLAAVALVLAVAGSSIVACAGAPANQLQVATSTSLLAYIVDQVGGNRVDVLNIVPASQHPGNFDARPGDAQRLAKASLFLVHGFPGETYVPDLVQAAGNPDLQVVTISFSGSWMTPEGQIAAAGQVATTLGEADPANRDVYATRAGQYEKRVRAKEAEIRQKLVNADVASLAALATIFQAPFAQWAGIKVVGTYATPESLTPQTVRDLVDKGKAAGVDLIIDNVHSGADAGKGLAEELQAKRVVLVYFPGGFPDTETWEKAFDYDADQLVNAARK